VRVSDLRAALLGSIIDTAEPGAGELCDAFEHALVDAGAGDGAVEVVRLKSRVYRLSAGVNGQARSFVLKRSDPWLGRRNELVMRRWLPAIGLSDRCSQLLATVADRQGRWVWHVYEDLGDGAVETAHPDHPRVLAVVDLIAELHTRAARHAVLPECRHYCGDLGASFFTANVRDAITVLEGLLPPRVEPAPDQAALRDRLLARLYRLRDEQPRRVQMLEALGGPDTLLHGDLWTANALVAAAAGGLTARLIDWDHAAVGPVSYDLSTFLYRFPRHERAWILEAYRQAMARAGWGVPATPELNVLFETAEYARYANRVIWPAVALLQQRAAWGWEQLTEIERWFETLEPALQD
jgi:thiamine kinase-like enzyme